MFQTIEFFRQHLPGTESNQEASPNLLIRAFNLVRDIPYSCCKSPERPRTFEELVAHSIQNQKATCTPKHFILGMYCEALGMKVEYLSYQFYWQEQPINFPKEIRSLSVDMPVQIHTAILVEPDNNHVKCLMDATWDRPLTAIGLPVNELTTSITDCQLGVVPSAGPVIHTSTPEQWEYLQSIKHTMPTSEVLLPFYNALDAWLIKSRPSHLLRATTK